MVLRIGRHINISQGFITAPWYAAKIGCKIFQIFLGSPRLVLSKARADSELVKFRKELIKWDIFSVIHSSYTINLCQPETKIKGKRSIKSLVQDLMASSLIGDNCLGVVVHMGKNVPEIGTSNEEAIITYANNLTTVLEKTPNSTRILLETGASTGTEVGSDIDGLSKIYHLLTENNRERIGFCIDTCHIWATGYDISNPMGVRNFFQEFDEKIGVQKIVCIHFNDSRAKFQSHLDQHADLGYGQIGSEGLAAFAIEAKNLGIPLIMETPLDAVNPATNRDITIEDELALVNKWINQDQEEI